MIYPVGNVAVWATAPNGAQMVQIFTTRDTLRRAASWCRLMNGLNPALAFRLYAIDAEGREAIVELRRRYGVTPLAGAGPHPQRQ